MLHGRDFQPLVNLRLVSILAFFIPIWEVRIERNQIRGVDIVTSVGQFTSLVFIVSELRRLGLKERISP